MNTVTCAMETRFLYIYIFNFFMATYKWMHPKYGCRVCKYLFCIHAKCYKHISPSYQTYKVCNFAGDVHIGYSHSLVFKDFTNVKWINSTNIDHIAIILFCILLWILLMWKPSEIFMIFELFLGQILWRARHKGKFLTSYLQCAISRKILEVSEIWRTVFRPNILQKDKMKSE